MLSAGPVGDREWQLTVSTAALSQPVRVDILLPEGYSSSTARYPVLYLYPRHQRRRDDWIDAGNAVAATAPYPLIVVMPDAGYNGDGGSWFTNWVDQHTSLGAANWETFHVDQLVPWVDANLRTVADRDGRAIAGLSQGGFGSFTYAARHPDTFVSAGVVLRRSGHRVQPGRASRRGERSSRRPRSGSTGWSRTPCSATRLPTASTGRATTPRRLVTNLGNTATDLWSGNGQPGPLDTPSVQIVPDAVDRGRRATSPRCSSRRRPRRRTSRTPSTTTAGHAQLAVLDAAIWCSTCRC